MSTVSAGKFSWNFPAVLKPFFSGVQVAFRGRNFGESLGDPDGDMPGECSGESLDIPNEALKDCLTDWSDDPQDFSTKTRMRTSPTSPMLKVEGITQYLPTGSSNLLVTSLKL